MSKEDHVCVYHVWFARARPWGFLHPRATGACPVTTQLTMRVNVTRATTATTTKSVRCYWFYTYSLDVLVNEHLLQDYMLLSYSSARNNAPLCITSLPRGIPWNIPCDVMRCSDVLQYDVACASGRRGMYGDMEFHGTSLKIPRRVPQQSSSSHANNDVPRRTTGQKLHDVITRPSYT